MEVQSSQLGGIRDKLPNAEPGQTLVERIRELVPFVLPPVARIAVITDGKNGLLHLQGRATWPLPKDKDGIYTGPYPENDGEAIAQVERARSEGAQFLLIPRTAFWWLDYYEGFRRHLAGSYRVAFRDEQTCMIIALHHETDPPDAGGAPDGLPLPPPELMAMTTGTYSRRTASTSPPSSAFSTSAPVAGESCATGETFPVPCFQAPTTTPTW